MFKSMRATLRWTLAIVLIAAGLGCAYLYRLWAEADKLVRAEIVKKLHELAPGCDVDVGRCSFDFRSRVHIEDLTLRPPGHQGAIVVLPRATIYVDREQLADEQKVIVRRVVLQSPRIDLHRDKEGHWNWQDLPKPPPSEAEPPEFVVEDGEINLHVEHPAPRTPVEVGFADVQARLIPAGKRAFRYEAKTDVEGAGKLALRGTWNVEHKTWKVKGSLHETEVDRAFLGRIARAVPDVGRSLVRLERRLQAAAPPQPGIASAASDSFPDRRVPATTVSASARAPGRSGPDLGVEAAVKVDFELAGRPDDPRPEYRILATLLRGRLDNPVLPFPLQDLGGKIYVDEKTLILRELSAGDGLARVHIDGRLERGESGPTGTLEVSANDVALNAELRKHLSGGIARLYDEHRPTGRVDVAGKIVLGPGGRWDYRDGVLSTTNGSVSHVLFPYRVTEMEGTIRQTAQGLSVDFTGNAGRRPVRIWGTVHDPGPAAEVDLHVRVDRFPIDDSFLRALPPEHREPLQSLDPSGVADIYARFERPPGYDQEFEMHLNARLHDCSVEFEDFRYRVEELSGVIANPNGNWTFTQLRGVHGAAELTGSGYWLTDEARGHLTVHVEDGQLDAELKRALPDDLKELWAEFSPGGKVNLTARLDWGDRLPLMIELPQMNVTEGSMLMASFPYPVRDITAQLRYDRNGVVWIDSFEGYRYQTRIKAKGFSQTLTNGDWRVRLNPVSVENLPADETLMRALPEDLRWALEYFNPTKPVSHKGMIEFRGTADPRDPVTAAWDVTTEFSGGTLSAGLDLDKIHGSITSAGTWDGEHLEIEGRANLDSVEIWEYKLANVRGPFRLIDDDLTVGSPKAFEERRRGRAAIPVHERITAEAVGGIVKLDALVDFSGEEASYVAKTSISHGQLEEYSKLYVTSGDYLRGTIDGWAVLRGSGDDQNNVVGTGQLKISPAALYDLPVIVEVFERLTFVPPRNGKGAFNYAQADFDIANSQFDFKSIYLRGDAISLHGRGQVSFDGKLSLDFYSRLSRNQIPIPFVNRVVSEVTKGWVGVRVRGTTAIPTTDTIPAPHLEGALKNLIGTIERGVPAAPPFLVAPPPGPPRVPRAPRRESEPRSGQSPIRERRPR